jgi:hypothetical protein
MGLATILVVIAGFWRSFYGTVAGTAPLTLLVNLHAAAFGAWLILFVAQTTLVATRRTAIHRRLGWAAGVLALLMIGLGYQTAIVGARHGFDLPLGAGPPDPLGGMVHLLGDLVSFTILVGAGFWYRHRPQVHKRLMLLATVGPMMNAPLVHFFFNNPTLPARGILLLIPMVVLLSASAVYDRLSMGRIHPVSLWGGVLLFAWGNVRAVVIGPSKVWHEFAAWLIS